MEGYEHNRQGNSDADRGPWHIAARPFNAAADQCTAREKGSSREKFAIRFPYFAQLAAVLMNPAANSQHDKTAEENHIAHPSVHQHMAETKAHERDETRMPRNFQNTGGTIPGGRTDRRGIGIDET